MTEFLHLELVSVLATLLAYQAGLLLQRRLKSALCNPILVAVVLVLGFLALTGVDNAAYRSANSCLSWLMTPATICLAIPMYEQLQLLRKNLRAIFAGVAAGAIACLGMILVFSLLAGFDRTLIITLLPKSVTSAIGVPLSSLSGGIASLTTAVIILTGILANVSAPVLCRLFRLRDDVAIGAALGTSGHVIGTARANEVSPLAGAVSSLSLVVAGLLTAVVFPLITGWI